MLAALCLREHLKVRGVSDDISKNGQVYHRAAWSPISLCENENGDTAPNQSLKRWWINTWLACVSDDGFIFKTVIKWDKNIWLKLPNQLKFNINNSCFPSENFIYRQNIFYALKIFNQCTANSASSIPRNVVKRNLKSTCIAPALYSSSGRINILWRNAGKAQIQRP